MVLEEYRHGFDIDGFSLHAAVRVEANDRKRLEQLCRYITRPALSDERVQINPAGQVELKLKTSWRDGTTHLVMSLLEFMQRLAALVPRPRLHLIRFHGVLAPNSKLRALVVPQVPRLSRDFSGAANRLQAAHNRTAEPYPEAHHRADQPVGFRAVDAVRPLSGMVLRFRRGHARRVGCCCSTRWPPACGRCGRG